MSYSRKKSNSGVEDMEFPRLLKKKYEKIPGVNKKKKMNFQGWSRKNHVKFPKGLGLWP